MVLFRLRCCLWLALLVGALAVAANVEKAVFVAGDGSAVAREGGREDDRVLSLLAHLPRLTPDDRANAWRTRLPAAFPWAVDFPANATTWVLLDDLRRGQRYELRVCWAATQPTAFSVDVFDRAAVAQTPALAAALAAFVAAGGGRADNVRHADDAPSAPPSAVARIVAAADYVAADRAAMLPGAVPPVVADLILDPFLLNVLPRSLAPAVAAVAAAAAASAWLARRVVLPQLRGVAARSDGG